MGLLAPLYALAALALAGPILFHLIRRQPRGELPFSSLMFLSPSPPRLTRRSRLDNLWLLALRGLALLLIAAAFMRPFLRQDSFDAATLSGRRVVLLLDTSGSMQRPDVWASAQRMAGEVLNDLSPSDQVGLYTIDRELTAHLPLDELHATDPRTTQRVAREMLLQLEPTWHTTQLVDGLKSIADLCAAQSLSAGVTADTLHQVVLVSDLHSGISLQGLQGFVWPDDVHVDVRQVLPEQAGNARPGLLLDDPHDPPGAVAADSATVHGASAASTLGTQTRRIRIEHGGDAPREGGPLSIAWANSSGPLPGQGSSVQVPPGQVRVVPLGPRPPTADRIVLAGDAWAGDNTLYMVEPSRASQRILFCGREQSRPQDDLSYFLKQAPLSSMGIQRSLEIIAADALPVQLATADVRAVVLEPTLEVMQQAVAIERFVDGGGIVLVCLAEPVHSDSAAGSSAADIVEFLRGVVQEPQLDIEESSSDDFSLLARIDFAHPVFAALSDPRFNDFSKLRFWAHRRLALPTDTSVRAVASLDDGAPWLLDAPRGAGRVWVLASGWQPTESGFGLSSKFIPLIMRMLVPQADQHPAQMRYEVGDRIDLANPHQAVVTTAQGETLDESLIARGVDSIELLQPGLFWLQSGTERWQVAVQVPVSESRLAAMDVAELEALGITLRPLASDSQRRDSQRQLQRQELEGKQRLWQWLLVAGLVVLALETWLAGWQSR